jgi:hypothetical protein
MHDAQSRTQQWFYEEKGKSKDGANEQENVEIISSGRLSYGSAVWMSGLTERAKLDGTLLRQHLQQTPPPLAGSQVKNTLAWVLALAPVIGYLMEWFAAGALNGSGASDGKRQLLVHHSSAQFPAALL